MFIFFLKIGGKKQDSPGKRGEIWVREKIQRLVDQSQTMGEEGTYHSHLGCSRCSTTQIPTQGENNARSSVPVLISLHTVW